MSGEQRGTPSQVSYATGQLRRYANILEDYRMRVAQVGIRLRDGGVTPVDWGVRVGIFHPTEGGDAMEYQPSEAPVELVRFMNAYERAHQAMITRLGKLEKVLMQDARIYRAIAKNYEQDDEMHIAEYGDLRGP